MIKTRLTPPDIKANYRAPALEKGLSVLELMAGSARSMNLTEISKGLQRTKQELFRVVACLHERGYLVRDESQRYRVSTKLFELGAKNHSNQALVVRAMPHMERLVDSLGKSCHLNIVVEDRMLVVARAECSTDVSLSVRVGASFELHRRISGRVALAFMSSDDRERYWRRSHTVAADIDRWEKEFERIRHSGFDLSDSPIVVGVKDCAVPVMGVERTLLCVLCVSFLVRVDESTDGMLVPRSLQSCAEAVSAEFSGKASHAPVP